MTADTATQLSLTISGRPEQVRVARAFVSTALGADHPCETVAILLASELVTNSVLYSDPRLPEPAITITVTTVPDHVRVEVRDAGGASVPVPGDAEDGLAEHGRGLRLVADLSARWGYQRDEGGLITWFEVVAEPLP